jgi:hypothetical protein
MNCIRSLRRSATRRSILTAAAVAALLGTSAGSLDAAPVEARQPPPDRKAACVDAACLVLLWDVDSDGDGVSDADETFLRTDPRDVDSAPRPEVVVSAALLRTLPSFENATSILVALPPSMDGPAVDLFGNHVRTTATTKSLAAMRSRLKRDGVTALDGRSVHVMDALARLDAALQSGADLAGCSGASPPNWRPWSRAARQPSAARSMVANSPGTPTERTSGRTA